GLVREIAHPEDVDTFLEACERGFAGSSEWEAEARSRSRDGVYRWFLDLNEVRLVDRAAVAFLRRCESSGVGLKNCPVYVRESISRQRRDTRRKEETTDEHDHHEGWDAALLQRLGKRAAGGFQPRLAAQRGGVRGSNVLPRVARL